MKPNKLTPGYNLRWESSRMMLPEHKQVLQRHQKELNTKTKPILDEQQAVIISRRITDSINRNMNVKIQLFDPYQDSFILGKIQKLVTEQGQMKVSCQDKVVWVRLDDIIDIQMIEDDLD
ncbi:YolD-like family protein [Aquibacillus sp. 3ASR75-11]|uniref:YolD-like family protein n=1 Tax=Terrihalobacillus insolitus TaxID=2950438 RepID=A0A9X3WTQ3_9BACI|nr:YolD-like family protein [Terrihalobacillus insolitus]MDC3414475.1 YolD-like family protein [Terrihalobacillus insolitus]MDC3425355.1 YolD-like family protein [Terrihalobacillus insolitus]